MTGCLGLEKRDLPLKEEGSGLLIVNPIPSDIAASQLRSECFDESRDVRREKINTLLYQAYVLWRRGKLTQL